MIQVKTSENLSVTKELASTESSQNSCVQNNSEHAVSLNILRCSNLREVFYLSLYGALKVTLPHCQCQNPQTITT